MAGKRRASQTTPWVPKVGDQDGGQGEVPRVRHRVATALPDRDLWLHRIDTRSVVSQHVDLSLLTQISNFHVAGNPAATQ